MTSVYEACVIEHMNYDKTGARILRIKRNIRGVVETDPLSSDFIEHGEGAHALQLLEEKLSETVPRHHTLKFAVPWNRLGINATEHHDYLKVFSQLLKAPR